MTQHHNNHNGDGRGEDSDSSGSEGAEEELSVCDEGGPARVLHALNALRKSRQHYDTVLVAGSGGPGPEVPAHRAVLAAASPRLLRALEPHGALAPHRVEGVDSDALRELVEYAYTGRARARDATAARSLYRAAWRLRVEPVRAHLAAALLRRLTPTDCLETRALPDLEPQHLERLDDYIGRNFEAVCESGALAPLPLVRIELLREERSPAGPGLAARPRDAPAAVADAALAWLRDRAPRHQLEELCSRVHMLYVDEAGALRDCGELPVSGDDAPELQEYRREAAERARRQPAAAAAAEAGAERGACSVLAARAAVGGGTRALLAVRGRLASARVVWRDVSAGGAAGTRDALRAEGPEGAPGAGSGGRRARLATGRCAHGAAAVTGRLLVCGGYDRARVLRSAETYDPGANLWAPAPELRGPRARFPAAALRGVVYAAGGSDGQAELDSMVALTEGAWVPRARLPLAVSHGALVPDEEAGALYLVGGWASGRSLKRVLRYAPDADRWTEMPPLAAGRSQCAAVAWRGALWALGGCDAWHCLASTETLALSVPLLGHAGGATEVAWGPGPPLPTARRSAGGVAWRGRLVLAGGSDGAASLRRVDWLEADTAGAGEWRGGPPLGRARAGLALVELAGTLYAVAGFDGKEFLSCVECLSDPDGRWTDLCTRDPPPRALPSHPLPSHPPDEERPRH